MSVLCITPLANAFSLVGSVESALRFLKKTTCLYELSAVRLKIKRTMKTRDELFIEPGSAYVCQIQCSQQGLRGQQGSDSQHVGSASRQQLVECRSSYSKTEKCLQ